MKAGAALALLAALAATAFLASRWYVAAAIALALLVVCLRAPARRRWPSSTNGPWSVSRARPATRRAAPSTPAGDSRCGDKPEPAFT